MPKFWWGRTTLTVPARHGLVRANTCGVKDDDGAFNGLGTSYFPAIALERTDPERLDRNLAGLSGQVDFIRIFGDVGGGIWSQRETRADLPDYWPVVGRLFERLGRYGLRAEVTIFAGSPVFHDYPARANFVSAWSMFASSHPEQVWSLEVCNEGIGAGSPADIQRLGLWLNAVNAHLIATTTPPAGQMWTGIDYVPPHYRRSAWPDYATQPWGGIPTNWLVANDEPEGIDSSVNQDANPVHLAAAALVTWISNNAWYTVHSGAGVYAQAIGTRKENLWEQPTFYPTLDAIRRWRAVLPINLCNWTKVNSQWANSPIAGVGGLLEGRIYCGTQNNRWVCCAFGRDILNLPLTAKAPLQLRDILTTIVLATVQPGERIPFGAQDAYVLMTP